jgi:TRAP-type mannitol/chloroaromatic compound transport system substrate-binding protein
MRREWVGPYDDEKLGSQRAKYYYYPVGGRRGPATPTGQSRKWNELPKQYQALVQACGREAGV